ncbi:MAG TPA: diguanylate cyclase, partial [Gammaproteobacteria bacterium]|nr:diguanylate cyclase [Gammaproteobacteria bacterium]
KVGGDEMRRLLLVLILCGYAFPSQAHLPGSPAWHYHAQSWAAEEGLQQTSVLAIAQGPDGFIWVGTQNGLARFDGIEFKTFFAEDHPGLASNYITQLLVDGPRMWVGTSNGVSVLQGGELHVVASASKPLGTVRGLAVAAAGGVWVAADHGLFLLQDGKATAVAALADTPAFAVAVDSETGLWVAVRGGVWHRAPGANKFVFVSLPASGATVYAIARWRGGLWLGTSNGLYVLANGELSRGEDELGDMLIQSLLAGPRGNLWVGTQKGLFRVGARQRVVSFTGLGGAGATWVRSLAADREGNVWVGAQSDGISRLWNNGIAVLDESAGLKVDDAWSVAREPSGRLWVGTSNGVYEFVDGRFVPRFDTGALPSPMVRAYLRYGGQLWIGTSKGLAIADEGRLLPLPAALKPLQGSSINAFEKVEGGGVWIGTNRGLYSYANGQLRLYGADSGLTATMITAVHAFADTLWVGTFDGIFAGHDGRFARVGRLSDGKTDAVVGIHRSRDGSIWFTLLNSGLARYREGALTRYGIGDGLPRGLFFGVMGNGRGTLWITMHNNVFSLDIAAVDRFDADELKTLPVRIYDTVDGDTEFGCNATGQFSAALDRSGTLWCPAPGAVFVLDTKRPPTNAVAPLAAITRTQSGNSDLAKPLNTRTFHLPPGSSDLQFTYTGLTFQLPEKVTFKYRLVGYESNWTDAGTRRNAFFTNLPPGDYEFQVKAHNYDGVWSETAATVSLIIEPFFYQTSWFRAVCLVAAAFALYGFYYWRMRHARAKQAALEAVVARRTAELREANERLAAASVTDDLTGLKNRRHLVEQIGSDIAQARRAYRENSTGTGANNDIVFLMIDVDDFKAVNDTYGHEAGDRLLVQISGVLTGQMRDSDYVIRWGGEEFLIVARQTERTESSGLAERLRRSLARRYELTDGMTVKGSCSIGYCAYPLTSQSLEQPGWQGIVALADIAMYRAKAAGKNAWVGLQGTGKTDLERVLAEARRDLDALVKKGELEMTTSEDAVSTV